MSSGNRIQIPLRGPMKSICISSFLSVIVAALAIAQQQTAPAALQSSTQTPTFKAAAEEIVLDIIVRDKKGKPIKDLTAADVKISDDGVDQKIKSIRLVEGVEAIEQGSRVPLDTMRQVRLVTLVFQSLGDSGRRIAKEAALNLVKGEQAQNVFYSVVTVGVQLNVLQSFTTNKDALKKAIELATSGKFATFAAESDRIKAELKEIAGRAGSPKGSEAPATPGTPA